MRLGVDRDLSLFHAFQQCGLGLGGCTVDLIPQHDVREHGSRAELEVSTLLVENVHAGDVRREHVRRELDAAERTVDRTCDRLREHRLTDAGNVLDQQVSLGDQRYQRKTDLRVLSAEDALHVLFDLSEAGAEALPFARLLTKLQPHTSARQNTHRTAPRWFCSIGRPGLPEVGTMNRRGAAHVCEIGGGRDGGAGWTAGRPARPLFATPGIAATPPLPAKITTL